MQKYVLYSCAFCAYYILFTKYLGILPSGSCCRGSTTSLFEGQYRHAFLHRTDKKTLFYTFAFSLNNCLWITVEEKYVSCSFHWASGTQCMAVSSSLDALANIHNQYIYTHQWELWILIYIASTCSPLFVKLWLFFMVHFCCLNVLCFVGFIFT